MVEGGLIDHAHHVGNAYRALTDTIELSDAVRAAVTMTDARDTLILVTADHSHVLTISGYPARGNPILGLVKAPGATGPTLDSNRQPYATLSYATGPGFALRTGRRKARRERRRQGAGPVRRRHHVTGFLPAIAGRHCG
jgi:alkaline phosphatase